MNFKLQTKCDGSVEARNITTNIYPEITKYSHNPIGVKKDNSLIFNFKYPREIIPKFWKKIKIFI